MVEKDKSALAVELIETHIRQCLELAGLPTGLGGQISTPLIIDKESRRDAYLLGYVLGWCDAILASGIDFGDKREGLYGLVLLVLFGGNGAGATFAKIFEEVRLQPVFREGVMQGCE